MLAVRIRLRTGQEILLIRLIIYILINLINSIHCFDYVRSGVFTVRGDVARVSAVNCCAIWHIGPVVGFLRH